MSKHLPVWLGVWCPLLTLRILAAFALGFIVVSQPGTLKAQDPVQPPTAGAPPNGAPARDVPPSTAPAALVPPSSPAPLSEGYLICPKDVLDVYVYDVPELTHSYAVNSAGTIIVPLLPRPVQAAGLTPEQFARALEEAFRQSGRLRRPEIDVSIKQSRNLTVFVDGAVKAPQILPEIGQTGLSDILMQCGGLSDIAGTTVTITRGPLAQRALAAEGEPAAPTLTVELKKVMDFSDPASMTAVWPGDHVSVEQAGIFYIMGEVRSPGGYTLKNGREELTVLRALAISGDATSVAKKSKAMIIRKDPNAANGRQEIPLNLKAILNGRAPDVRLEANDILFIPGSNGKKALHTLTSVPSAVVTSATDTAVLVH